MAKIQRGLSRQDKETGAIRDVDKAQRDLAMTHSCSPEAVYGLVRANREIAQARTKLVTIGYRDSARTMKLWAVVGKVEKQVNAAGNRVAKCLLKHGGLDGLRRRRRRR